MQREVRRAMTLGRGAGESDAVAGSSRPAGTAGYCLSHRVTTNVPCALPRWDGCRFWLHCQLREGGMLSLRGRVPAPRRLIHLGANLASASGRGWVGASSGGAVGDADVVHVGFFPDGMGRFAERISELCGEQF